MRTMTTVTIAAALVAIAMLLAPQGAVAAPVATTDAEYTGLGRVFPDPLAGCQVAGTSPCDPNAQGNVQASTFIGIEEYIDALEYMNTSAEHAAWQRYMEVLPLDGQIGANGDGEGVPAADLGAGDTPGDAMFPGNALPLEFDPQPSFQSAGLPTETLEREKSDLVVVRVTDETVPDAGKKRYALSLSIHGIERAGAEGGIRTLEDLVTAATTPSAGDGQTRLDDPIVPASVKEGAPTFGDVLRESIIYFTFPNPDGWRRGSFMANLFPSYQRYNGNGVDPNRDWPDIGYTFRGYSAASEPETKAFISFYRDTEANGGEFFAGDDLHGQLDADALSYTLLPHGSKDFAKDLRAREVAKRINRGTFEAIKWHPRIQENDQPVCGTGNPGQPLVDDCPRIYAQTWGTVYDTINYTTTGALGDWFDSVIGLGADGIDNEMSFSHLDRDIVFDKGTEQLHVQGNKALIYARLVEILEPPSQQFGAPGRKGYVANKRLTRDEQVFQPGPPPNTVAQDPIEQTGVAPGEFPFEVKRTEPSGGQPGIFNGGMNVTVTAANAGGQSTGLTGVEVQCRFCDDHPGLEGDDGWITVSEDFNQSFLYRQSGVIASVNRPQAVNMEGKAVEWRAVVSHPTPELVQVNVDFTQGPASQEGETGGGLPPVLAAYDVANTDFFEDLNPYLAAGEKFEPIDPRRVIAGGQSLAGLRSLVLADDPLPGYTGQYEGEAPPGAEPTEDFSFSNTKATAPGQGAESCARNDATTERKEFTIAANEANESLTVRIEWALETSDWDLYLSRKRADGSLAEAGSSAGFLSTSEELSLSRPAPGDYVIEVVNCSAADPNWSGTATFEPLEVDSRGPSEFTVAEKDAWFEALREYVEGGGNLVLTDGSLRAIGELTSVPGSAASQQTVYVGQMTFDLSEGDGDETTGDPLASDPVTVEQPAARFNSGMRRQTFEPTPLGFSIQNAAGGDQSNARQYDLSRTEFEDAGGRVAATSASASPDGDPVYDRVTLGEIGLGNGQIRVAGALLPQPSQEFDHTFGIEPYAATYTGYILMRNLLEVDRDDGDGPGDDAARGGTDTENPSGGGIGGGGERGAGVGGGGGTAGAGCFRAARTARGNRVGRAGLARRRSSVRGTFGAKGRYRRFVDRYCLRDGSTVRVAYPTHRERARLSRSERRRIGRESIFVLTTSRSLQIRGVRRGMGVRGLHRRIGRGDRVRVGRNLWYFRKGRNSRHIFKVQDRRVREMGIADARLTKGRARAKRFFRQGR